MLKDKKGLSAIVMTIIMIGLVLVAVGIVWVVVLNIIEGQSESVDYDQRCLGLSFDIKNLDCDEELCSFVVERKTGSKGDPIGGIAVTFSSDTQSSDEFDEGDFLALGGNIAASKTINNMLHNIDSTPTRADARIYFVKDDDSYHYCSQIVSSE